MMEITTYCKKEGDFSGPSLCLVLLVGAQGWESGDLCGWLLTTWAKPATFSPTSASSSVSGDGWAD